MAAFLPSNKDSSGISERELMLIRAADPKQAQSPIPLNAPTAAEIQTGLAKLPQELKDMIEEHTMTYAGEFRHLSRAWKPPAMLHLNQSIRRKYIDSYFGSSRAWSVSADLGLDGRSLWISSLPFESRRCFQQKNLSMGQSFREFSAFDMKREVFRYGIVIVRTRNDTKRHDGTSLEKFVQTKIWRAEAMKRDYRKEDLEKRLLYESEQRARSLRPPRR